MSLRRRLLLYSAPVAVIVLIVVAKLISVTIAGNNAASHFRDGDSEAMRGDIAVLHTLNVVESAKAYFADGAQAVLEDRLEDADQHFSAALTRTEPVESCSVRVNLVLVRETLGDRAAAAFDAQALDRYAAARELVITAPEQCFADNTDPDPQRNTVRGNALSRLDAKIRDATAAVPPPGQPPPPEAGAAPGAPPAGNTEPDRAETTLDPGRGDPLERLQQILQDAA